LYMSMPSRSTSLEVTRQQWLSVKCAEPDTGAAEPDAVNDAPQRADSNSDDGSYRAAVATERHEAEKSLLLRNLKDEAHRIDAYFEQRMQQQIPSPRLTANKKESSWPGRSQPLLSALEEPGVEASQKATSSGHKRARA